MATERKRRAKNKPSPRRAPNPAPSPAPGGRAPSYRRAHWGRAGTGPVQIAIPDPSDAELVVLGRVVEITYETTKGDRGTLTDYVHKSARGPLLVYDRRDARAFFLARSAWQMTERGIVG